MNFDPVLAAIATSTNDALTEHLWRYDTAGTDPVADLAIALHRIADDFTATTQVLTRTLRHLQHRCAQQLDLLTHYATTHRPHDLDSEAVTLLQHLERHDTLRESLLAAYAAWRRHRPLSRDPHQRYLLPQPYDPAAGIVALATDPTHACWLVVPNDVAAARFGLPTGGNLIGDIRPTGSGRWQPTAYTHPKHPVSCPHLVHQLPEADDEAAACRALLRWWAQRSDAPVRTPSELTSAERAAPSA